MIQPTKTPIIILSAPRTGSTVLGSYIQSMYDTEIKYFQEPDYIGQEEIDNFSNYSKESNNFIFKCQFMNLHRYDQDLIDHLLSKAYKIRLRRKDFIKQVASLQIVYNRKQRWHYISKDQLDLNDTVPINIESIKRSITLLKEANSNLDNANINFDLDLYYEDLPKINNAGFYITPKPLNYNELLDAIKSLVEIS